MPCYPSRTAGHFLKNYENEKNKQPSPGQKSILDIVADIGLTSQYSSSCFAMKLFNDMVRLSMK